MSTPQDGPTRKKQKARAVRKLAAWRKKQAEKSGTEQSSGARTPTKR